MILLRGVAGGNMTALIPHESKSTARGGARNLAELLPARSEGVMHTVGIAKVTTLSTGVPLSRALGVSANLEAARWFRLRGTRVQR